MTNYQSDMFEYFEEGTDYVMYDGPDDLIDKCKYYLEHDDKRKSIAINGHNKIKAHHTYEMRFKDIFDIMFRQVDR